MWHARARDKMRTKQEKHPLDMHLVRWRLIRSTADGVGELTVYVDEDRRIVDVHVGNLACFCGKWCL